MTAAALTSILRDIKLGHSVFALPFAALGLLWGTRGEVPSVELILRVVLAMVFARSAAMAFNRLVDHGFDATNPRTSQRALPSGAVARGEMIAFLVICSAAFIGTSATFGPLCMWLSPFVLAVLFAYSLTKRVTQWAHLFVGIALALSPPAAYLAARGSIGDDILPVLWLSLAVIGWVAGFDIIYACQDTEHDRREGLFSIPSRRGVLPALAVSRKLHAVMLIALGAFIVTANLATWAWIGFVIVALLIAIEHMLVRGGDLSRVNAAFFTINGVVSIAFAVCAGVDILWP